MILGFIAVTVIFNPITWILILVVGALNRLPHPGQVALAKLQSDPNHLQLQKDLQALSELTRETARLLKENPDDAYLQMLARKYQTPDYIPENWSSPSSS